jgi:hypothetical protein
MKQNWTFGWHVVRFRLFGKLRWIERGLEKKEIFDKGYSNKELSTLQYFQLEI